MNLYSVEDKVAGSFSAVSTFDNDALAIRAYKSAVNSKADSIMCTNPGDFALYRLGEIDLLTGEIKPAKEFVINLIDLKEGS